MEGGFRDAELFDKPCSYALVGVIIYAQWVFCQKVKTSKRGAMTFYGNKDGCVLASF